MLSQLYKSADFKEDLSGCKSWSYKNSLSRVSLTKSENVSLGAHNDMSLCFLICYDEAYKIITILLEELSCQKSQSFEHSSLKKALKSLESLY